ncbi:MAG: endonuclease [Serratia liquefaciens]|nr:endonuclease [Serratia liquefaciens]
MYQYPEHLTGEVANLPQSCGVYFFHGDNGAHPLYIGKSVNIRRRVQSHLRNPREARLLAATRRITCIETVGEIGALLLESSLVKQQSPLYNKRLRKIRRLCALQVQDSQTRIVYSDALDFSRTPNLYGLFLRRAAAVDFLIDIADREQLCLTYLDIEKGRPGQPCFRHQLGKCAGVCCGKETPQAHQSRLLGALEQAQVRHWPFPGRIAIEERQGQLKAFHVISNWFYLGTAPSLSAAEKLSFPADEFDRDCYRILCRRLFHESREHIHLIDPPAP